MPYLDRRQEVRIEIAQFVGTKGVLHTMISVLGSHTRASSR